ncbi:MAG: VOC family protein [Stackebrandtia sp.]
MDFKIVNIAINTPNPRRLADWWVSALEGEIVADYEVFVFARAAGIGLGFQQSDETGPNRVHFDVVAPERAAAVELLLERGATHVADRDAPGGMEWTVLADPEGNEFCVASGSAHDDVG